MNSTLLIFVKWESFVDGIKYSIPWLVIFIFIYFFYFYKFFLTDKIK